MGNENKNDFCNLSSDINYECIRALRAIKLLEKDLFNLKNEKILNKLSLITQSLDQISNLSKILESNFIEQKSYPVEQLFKEIKDSLEELSQETEKQVLVKIKDSTIKIDKDLAYYFLPIMKLMLKPLLEFSIESKKERLVRKKNIEALIELSAESIELGFKIKLFCDGNGLLPPFSYEIGEKLAKLGVRAHFEGRPGISSTWTFFLPKSDGLLKFLPVRYQNQFFAIPLYTVIGIKAEKDKFNVEISVGLKKRSIYFDDVAEPIETYVKKMHPLLSAHGRFKSILQYDTSLFYLNFKNESIFKSNELILVIDPMQLVYGDFLETGSKVLDEVSYAI
jgi:hypothetical protein